LGSEECEVLLPPHGRATLSIPKVTFTEQLKIESPEQYNPQSLSALLPVQIRVRSTNGKYFESKGLRYWEAIGEFRRA
jgi:hypothetical protein